MLEFVLQPPVTEKAAFQVLYAERISVSVEQAVRLIGVVGQLTARGIPAATSKVELQVSVVVLQSSVAERIKLKETA